MNFKELTEKVVADSTTENPYLSTDDIQGIADEIKGKDDTITSLNEELTKIKNDYQTLKDRIVDQVLKGKDVKEDNSKPINDLPKGKEEPKEEKTLQDLIKADYKDFIR